MIEMTERVRALKLRQALIKWLSDPEWTHAMTFVYNRPVSIAQAKKMFGQFCHEMDRLRFGKRNVHTIPSADRFKAVGCFEHIDTNIHLHVSARLDGWLDKPPTDADFVKYRLLWRKCTRASGNLLCEPLGSAAGWANYFTKELYANDNEYVLASDFHPTYKLNYG